MKKQLFSTHQSDNLQIGNVSIPCAVLNDGTRVLTTRGFLIALGRPWKGSYKRTELPNFIDAPNLRPFISKDLMSILKPIEYTNLSGGISMGYKAELLPLVCDVYLTAREEGAIKTVKQKVVAKQAEILVRSLAKVAIIALVDEATGYQQYREKDALHQFLNKFLLEEHAKWVKTFQDDFFEMIFKMKHWTWNYASTKKPQVVGHYINDFVYSRLAPNVLDELRIKNPPTGKSGRKYKHTQFIDADFGHPKIKEHISALVALGRASGYNWNAFKRLVERAFPKFGETKRIEFPDED